jgi:hypothetical protein
MAQSTWATPGPRGVARGDSSGLVKLAWIRDPSVPPGRPALGRFDCPCGARIDGVKYGSDEDHPCLCGRVWDGHGWLVGGKV